MKVKLAAIQMQSPMGKLKQNMDHAEAMIRDAASQGAKIIVTPECCLPGYCSNDIQFVWHEPGRDMEGPQFALDVNVVAKKVPGEETERFASLANELDVHLMVGLIESGEDGKFYNTSVLLNPPGEIALKYRKRHPWPMGEGTWATKGNLGVPVYETAYGKVACGICYDIQFDVPAQAAKQGVDLFLFPAAWTEESEEDAIEFFQTKLPQIARENKMALIFANRNVAKREWWRGSGRSSIYRRDGSIVACSSKEFEEDIVLAELDI